MKLNSGCSCTVSSMHKRKWNPAIPPASAMSDPKISFSTKMDLWRSQIFFHGPNKPPTTKSFSKTNQPTWHLRICPWFSHHKSTTPRTLSPKSSQSDSQSSVQRILPIINSYITLPHANSTSNYSTTSWTSGDSTTSTQTSSKQLFAVCWKSINPTESLRKPFSPGFKNTVKISSSEKTSSSATLPNWSSIKFK